MMVVEEQDRCEVCERNEFAAVLSVPGIPYAARYCHECASVGAMPYWVMVANTQAIGGMEHCADWWDRAVQTTLDHLDKTREQFDRDVAADPDAYEWDGS